MTAQQSIEEKQNLINAFPDDPKTKYSIRLKIIIRTMSLMGTGINLIRAWQIIIIDSVYTSYAEEKDKGRITRIGQINCITIHFLVCYNVGVEIRIKCCHHKYIKMIKETVWPEFERGKVSRSFLANQM